jgi:hypothetical protein
MPILDARAMLSWTELEISLLTRYSPAEHSAFSAYDCRPLNPLVA